MPTLTFNSLMPSIMFNRSNRTIDYNFSLKTDASETYDGYQISLEVSRSQSGSSNTTYTIIDATLYTSLNGNKPISVNSNEKINLNDSFYSTPPNTFFTAVLKATLFTGDSASQIISMKQYYIRDNDYYLNSIANIGINDIARSIQRAYVGVDNKAREVKKVYVGIDNKAQLIYESLPSSTAIQEYSGAGTSRWKLQGYARAGDYAVFAGGVVSSGKTTTVEAFSRNMVKVSAPSIKWVKDDGVGITIGDNAFCAGGWQTDAYPGDEVTMFTPSLTMSFASPLYYRVGNQLATKAGDFGIIAGGWHTESLNNQVVSYASAWNHLGGRITLTPLTSADQAGSIAAYVGGKGLIIRNNSNAINEVYTQELVQHTFSSNIANPGNYVTTASSPDYAMVYNRSRNSVCFINSSLTVTEFSLAATSSVIQDNSQANYLSKATEQTPNGCFIIYGMIDGGLPERIIIDAKRGTVLQSITSGTRYTGLKRERCGGVEFPEAVVMYNGFTGRPIYFKPTSD